ncbi:MAG: hypothetical protein ACO1TE_14010 [Prosthecobacter sp.]
MNSSLRWAPGVSLVRSFQIQGTRLLKAGMVAAVLAGCVDHRPYRLLPPDGSRQWSEHKWSKSDEYFTPADTTINVAEEVTAEQRRNITTATPQPRFSVVELDDNGEFWSRKQQAQALEMLRRSPKPPLTILYVHGWKHNASDNSGDYQSFRQLLARLALKKELTDQHTICGIYVGWRGDVLGKQWEWTGLGFLPRQITIYNRMDAADRIANGLPFTQFISSVSEGTYQAGKKGRCVMIGHSLGARILETTLSRTLSTAATPGPNPEIKKPADLVLLVNPASDGLRARQTLLGVQWAEKSLLRDLTSDGRPGEHYHVPLVVYIRSETDKATSWIYRTAMVLGKGITRKTRTYPPNNGRADHTQFDYITRTAPTMPHLLSHQVVSIEDMVWNQSQQTPLDFNLGNKVALNRFPLTLNDNTVRWYAIVPDTQGEFKMYAPEEKKRGSCWIMQVPAEVLNGHSGERQHHGIFSESMIDFFAALYRITMPGGQSQSAQPRLAAPLQQREQPLQKVEAQEKAAKEQKRMYLPPTPAALPAYAPAS